MLISVMYMLELKEVWAEDINLCITCIWVLIEELSYGCLHFKRELD